MGYFRELLLGCLTLFMAGSLFANDKPEEKQIQTEKNKAASQVSSVKPDFAAVPFVFSSENLSTAFGAAGVIKHAGQVQASLLGIGLYTTNDSWVSYLAVNDYQLPQGLAKQWLFGMEYYQGVFRQGTYFIPQTGISDDSQRIITHGEEDFLRLHATYILPIGRGKDGAVPSLMPNNQAISWNPLHSGISKIRFTPFIQHQALAINQHLAEEAKGLELMLEWDNRDNAKNSSQGGQSKLKIRHAVSTDTTPDWTTWEFEQSGFFSIGNNDFFRQQILATNVYLADTPTWNSQNSEGDYHRPPSFAGVSLGGFERLRGYSSRRFTGRSALLYSLEYRVQPHWQPLSHWPIFNLYDVPWWQWVLFAEAGQVTDEFSMSALHQDMKWSVGGAVRFEVESVVVRAELGVSQESNQFWVMVSQPF